ncbi:hypothetical protein S7711_06116 [Stachybotrys chartarum IBT 7711]|uniref:Tyrosinase copper-binding domain-containing protein n=1 Tax=Stachybotrys chartarum (strain CBS 109288 / IBT 7711) TaxID=1280523 RepID=A0A084B663_STACB|nr:hypothetical protein S7711_06116 [Stachybotrys chartarum IBT 7711]KFA56586.1 hypothetical protein S40293_01142 [Stachybotrys chartarum IBT 40293]
MRPELLLMLGLTGVSVGQYPQRDIDSGLALGELSRQSHDAAVARLRSSTGGCTPQTIRVRKECLYSDIPGARSRFDDFGVLHYRLTNFVHLSASFLLFHRYYIWTYEEALRTECNFNGHFPYWNWGEDAHDVESSPLFDGSPTSLGSNGRFVRGGGTAGLPKGSGGGCLIEGPFSDRNVTLGPFSQRNPLNYNPRCIKRDLNTAVASRWASFRNTTEVIINSPTVEMFQALVQGDSRYPEARNLGVAVHGGGHFAIGGDPGGDFHFSPLEPAFYLHHGQVDRLYFIWQNLDWTNRQLTTAKTIFGTGTMNNRPPSRNQTLDDVLDLSPLAPPRKLGDLIDTVGASPLCFVYE